MTSKKTTKKRGRPTKYKKEFCDRMVEWFDRELTILKEVDKIEYGKVVKVEAEAPNEPPMFGTFARQELGIYHQTMITWTKQYPEFNEAYRECKQIQRDFIVMGCLMGHLNSNFGRFTMKNISEWRDNIETHVSTDKNNITLAYALRDKS